MKTKSEWGAEFYKRFGSIFTGHEEFIEQIQLDAFKAGMTRAAEVAHPTFERYVNRVEPWLGLHDSNLAESIEKQILTTRDNLNEKDLG